MAMPPVPYPNGFRSGNTTQLYRLETIVMRNLIIRFAANQSGSTTIEYGLIAAGISVAVISIVGSVGSQIRTMFTSLLGQLTTFNVPS
jgi:pilus assembly protein Flp/PilA